MKLIMLISWIRRKTLKIIEKIKTITDQFKTKIHCNHLVEVKNKHTQHQNVQPHLPKKNKTVLRGMNLSSIFLDQIGSINTWRVFRDTIYQP